MGEIEFQQGLTSNRQKHSRRIESISSRSVSLGELNDPEANSAYTAVNSDGRERALSAVCVWACFSRVFANPHRSVAWRSRRESYPHRSSVTLFARFDPDLARELSESLPGSLPG